MSAKGNVNMGAIKVGHIQINNLSISFESNNNGAVEAVKNVSMEVFPGEFVAIIGPSGCGKSTLLNVVAGFIAPTEGEVLMDASVVTKPGVDRGMVFQQFSLFPWKTVRKNVEFGMKMLGVPASQRKTAARKLLGLTGLSSFENHYPDQLSGGMKQRVGIVRALATNPRVLLMDEPFGALDAQTRAVMQQILTNMWQRFRHSVLFITHDIDEAIFLADRIYVMTSRPGTFKAVLDVALERPRVPEMETSETFLELRRTLLGLIREESLKAMGGELREGGYADVASEAAADDVFDFLPTTRKVR